MQSTLGLASWPMPVAVTSPSSPSRSPVDEPLMTVRLLVPGVFILSVVLFFVIDTTNVAAEVAAVVMDPDVGLNVTGIIEARGYAVETHTVTTADRFVLTMYRLPKSYEESQSEDKLSVNKPVVLLQHGLLASSFTFVCNFRNQSLAFILADAGYDVWMGNNRGSTWSRDHLDYTVKDAEFWDFTWEDMGKFDLPAEIKYVLKTTKQSTLSFVGHSEGTTQAFVAFSTDQELAKKVSYFAALAPVAWTGHITGELFKAMAKLHIEKWYQTFGIVEFSSKHKFIQEVLAGFTCTLTPALCNTTMALVTGPSANLNMTRIPVYVSQMPAGTSVKNMAHFAQGIRDDTFASYDYGCKCDRDASIEDCREWKCENKKVYGTFDPPVIPVEDMVYPRTGLFIGAKDTIATSTNIKQLRSALPSKTIVHELTVEHFSHQDLAWAYNANENVFQDVLLQLDNYDGVGYTDKDVKSSAGASDDVAAESDSFSFRSTL